jgi:Meiotically up-regulated gene 113
MRYVYLIRANDGRYKIGIAKNPNQRISQLQTGNSDKLKLIETYQSENASKIESALHNRYSHARNVGEWFDLSVTEEANFIEICRNIDESIKTLRKMGNLFV